MTNKLTVLGLVAATAFIFTSCTKDNDTSLNDRLIAPVATLNAPALNDESNLKGINEYAEADNGQSIPSMETAPVAEPGTTAPTWNNVDRYQQYYMGVKEVPYNPTSPVSENAEGFRYGQFYMGVKEVPGQNNPNVLPYTWMNPVGVSTNGGRLSGNGELPDCTFPVVGTQVSGKLEL